MTGNSSEQQEKSVEPRSILMVSYEYPPLGGGGGVILRDLAQELARQLEVTVLTSGMRGLDTHERHGALEIVRAPVLLRRDLATASLPSMLSFYPSSLRAGGRLLRERRFDLVHSCFAVPSAPSGLRLARRAGLPHVLSIHGGDIYDPTKALSPHRIPLLRDTVRWVIGASDRVVTSSQDIEDRARQFYGASHFERIPLAIDPPKLQEPVSRQELGYEDDELLLVTVGRLVARKGLDRLLEVLAGLPASQPRWKLLIVGEGPQRDALETRARELGIADRIVFEGFVSDERKWQLLAASDLYVSTTLHEGFGIVFLEAMQCGLPVLTTDCGGQRDFVDDEVGALVPVDDGPRMLAALRQHLEDPALRARKSAAARERAREFGIERHAERHLALYRKCLAERSGPAPG